MQGIPLLTKEQKEKAKHLKKSLKISEIMETKGIYYDKHPDE